jgi:hypothetical protein
MRARHFGAGVVCRIAAYVVAGTATITSGCSTDRGTSPANNPLALGPVTPPTATANPYSVLSSIVTFDALPGDSARVISSATGDSSTTPYTHVVAKSTQIATLGLLPNTTYTQILQIRKAKGAVEIDTLQYTTAALPSYVQRATLTQLSGTFSGGYTLVSPLTNTTDTALAVAFDSANRVRWYRIFPGTLSTEIKQQPNGNFTIFLVDISSYLEFLPSGDSLRTYLIPTALTDDHEIWLQGGGTERATATLWSSEGADTLWHVLWRLSPGGSPVFEWHTDDHYLPTDALITPGDYDHPNSIDFDLDSNYILSFRNLSQILKLDAHLGTILWQMGGTHNQFTFINDPQADSLGGTSGQHSVRVLGNGHLLIYDDGNLQPTPHSRAVEYVIDTVAKTATLLWQYLPNPAIFTPYVGSVQRLDNGHTLVGFGAAGQIHEVDATSNLVGSAYFQLNGQQIFYRANRIQSLYTYSPLNGR